VYDIFGVSSENVTQLYISRKNLASTLTGTLQVCARHEDEGQEDSTAHNFSDFSLDLILPTSVALGSTHPVIEMSTRNLPGGKRRPVHKAGNLTASVRQLSRKCGRLDVLVQG
jgi:hypothetical protein